ncbi:MAG TPA: sulfite exporter TauE/SafE family protein [Candidatus Limnocylindrales bacterium]
MIAGVVLLLGGAFAGVFGALLGLGGGILIVPLLNLGFGLDLRVAVAVSLVSVIVTSSASAGVYLEKHVANLRLGMVLELFSASGALVGGLIAFLLSEQVLAGLFSALLIWVAVSMVRSSDAPAAQPADAAADGGEAELVAKPTFTDTLAGPGYNVRRLPFGIAGSLFAGLVSALLGVGGGIVKVPTMHLLMGVPLKVATATSNMMIGITATSSAVIYLLRGQVDPFVAGPVAVGVFAGAVVGTRVAHRIDVRTLRWLFVAVLAYTAFQMGQKALGL